MAHAATIAGEIEAIQTFSASWSVATLRIQNGTVTVVGKLLGASLGDHVEAQGAWTEHPKYGRQFRSRDAVVTVPQSKSGIVSWLASKLPQLGQRRAVALVEAHGERVWEVIETRPETLLEIKGITPERLEAIVSAYRAHRTGRDEIVKLKGWGLTDHQISILKDRYGGEVERALRENPYRLCDEVKGFGFKRADGIAKRMGLPPDSPLRIVAAMRFVLDEAAGAGHVYVPRGKLVAISAALLNLAPTLVHAQVGRLCSGEAAVERGMAVYLGRLDLAEAEVANRVRAMNGVSASDQ